MNLDLIESYAKMGVLRKRIVDKQRVNSLINASRVVANSVIKIALDETTSTTIFREIYESIRQLGVAKWWILGYEPLNHEISLNILEDEKIKNKLKLNLLSRFRLIRNESNYQGFLISVDNAKEIIDFWELCGEEIILNLEKRLNS